MQDLYFLILTKLQKRKQLLYNLLWITVKFLYFVIINRKNLSEEFFSTFYRQSCIWRFYVHSQKSQISSFAITSFLITSAVTLISLLSDIVFQLTRFNDPRSPSSLLSSSYPFPSFFHNQSAALVPKCRKKGEAPFGHSVHNVEW